MTGDLVTSSQSSASRAKAQLAQLLQTAGDQVEELVLPSARQKLQVMDTPPSNDELAELLLGIGKCCCNDVLLLSGCF